MDDTDTKAPSASPTAMASGSPGSPVASARKQFEDIFIEVKPRGLQPVPPPAVDTEIYVDLTQIGSTAGGRLKVKQQIIELDATKGPFRIKFKLKDWLEWREGDPFWIIKDSCPTNEDVDHQQIWLDKKPTGKTITIVDMNVDAACALHYRLNFEGNVFCDPIIENGGGNKM